MNVDKVSTQQQRERIPTFWLVDFNAQSNAALASLAADDQVREEVRAYAQWELGYREAWGILQVYDPTGRLHRFEVATDLAAEQAQAEIDSWRHGNE